LKFGVAVPNYGENLTAEAMVAVAREAEALGFDSVWVTDHILMQRSSGTPYERIFESLTALSYLAGATERVVLGVSALIIAMRNPVIAAKQLATVDALSGGRLALAIGAGWNEKEFSSVGSDFGDRGRREDESIRIVRELFEGITSFRGARTRIEFRNVVFEPHPTHKVPIWIGGNSPSAMKRASTLGDAWHPNLTPLEDFVRLVSEFRRLQGAEKRPIHVRIGLNAKSSTGEYVGAQGDRRILLSADQESNRLIMQTLEELRIDGIVVATSPTGKATLEEQLEGLRMIRERFMPPSTA
jgi:probable F420-dependent oxidoreductase